MLDPTRAFVASSVPMLRSRQFACASLAVAALTTLNACGTDLGPCDMAAAESLVYKRGRDSIFGCVVAGGCDDDPTTPGNDRVPVTFYVPYTVGQAVAHASCGNGGVCHSAAASGAGRFGAPGGLNFDLAMRANVVTPTAALSNEAGIKTIREWREESWELIDSGEMPPGDVGKAVQADPTWHVRSSDAPNFESTPTHLPSITTNEGKELVRNWLACGAPIPAATQPLGQRNPPVVIEPTWDAIYDALLSDTCVFCHGNGPELGRNAGLVFNDACASWKALVNRRPSAESLCATYPGDLVIPGDPMNSLLLEKIDHNPDPTVGDRPACGFAMPYSGAQLSESDRNSVRTWIANGALPPTGCAP